jgi:hypothetical protein
MKDDLIYQQKLPRYYHGEKTLRIDLGLAILSARARPGERYSYEEIAAFCGCSKTLIQIIEARAIRKISNLLLFRDRRLGAELRCEFFDRQKIAQSKNARLQTFNS